MDQLTPGLHRIVKCFWLVFPDKKEATDWSNALWATWASVPTQHGIEVVVEDARTKAKYAPGRVPAAWALITCVHEGKLVCVVEVDDNILHVAFNGGTGWICIPKEPDAQGCFEKVG